MSLLKESLECFVPKIGYCEEKSQLMAAYLEAIRELVAWHNQQTSAVIEGDPEFSRFDVLIHMANQKKDRRKYELFSHIDSHRC